MYSFSRSQVSSAAATVLDYGALVFCTEVLGIWYVIGTAVGALAGAVTNFLINRHWSFRAGNKSWSKQARRYALVSASSLLLNTGGVYLLTEFARLHYMISVVVVSLLVGFLFNYPLYKNYVYL